MLDVLDPVLPDQHSPAFDWWAVASQEFCRRIDDKMRERYPGHVLPWERRVAVGEIDYWRAHAYALERFGQLLVCVLPLGDFTDRYSVPLTANQRRDHTKQPRELTHNAWRGRHDERSNWITVSLMTGAWFDPAASKRGNDLVGLVAHVYRLTPRRAAIRLGQWLGIEAVRHG